MFRAYDKNGKPYSVQSAKNKKITELFCPSCKSPVHIVEYDAINDRRAHFAHNSSDRLCNPHESDMSEWHIEWQERFPEECREVVKIQDNQTRIADVMIGNLVIEFQHSPIQIDTFRKRNEFYTSLGYRVIWIFDIEELADEDIDYDCEKEYFTLYKSLPFFQSLDLKSEMATIYFQQFDPDLGQEKKVFRISKFYSASLNYYTDDKRTFPIDEFVNNALFNQAILFPDNNHPDYHHDYIQKQRKNGGKTITELFESKYQYILVVMIDNNLVKYWIYRDKKTGEIIRDQFGRIKGKTANGQGEWHPLPNGNFPVWKRIYQKDKI